MLLEKLETRRVLYLTLAFIFTIVLSGFSEDKITLSTIIPDGSNENVESLTASDGSADYSNLPLTAGTIIAQYAIGIATPTPQSPLHVKTPGREIRFDSGNPYGQTLPGTDGGGMHISGAIHLYFNEDDESLVLRRSANRPIEISNNAGAMMYLKGDGKIGIGTRKAFANLSVAGESNEDIAEISIGGGAGGSSVKDAIIRKTPGVYADDPTPLDIIASSSEIDENSDIRFFTSDYEDYQRMIIKEDGKVAIGAQPEDLSLLTLAAYEDTSMFSSNLFLKPDSDGESKIDFNDGYITHSADIGFGIGEKTLSGGGMSNTIQPIIRAQLKRDHSGNPSWEQYRVGIGNVTDADNDFPSAFLSIGRALSAENNAPDIGIVVGPTDSGDDIGSLRSGIELYRNSNRSAAFVSFDEYYGLWSYNDAGWHETRPDLKVDYDTRYVSIGHHYYDSAAVRLDVNGDIKASGNVTWSDRRWKKNITRIENPLQKVLNLRGVKYDWNKNDYPERDFSEGTQIGLIAQEVEEVLPELVSTDPEGYKSLQYDKIVSVLVEAIKEQQQRIDALESKIESIMR